jgi:GNAT superfamily N-acetyltransferase
VPADTRIRRPTASEASLVADRLLAPSYEAAAENDPEFDALATDALDDPGIGFWRDHDDRTLFVADAQGALVGVVTGRYAQSPPVYARGDRVHCDGLYVLPPFRRRGIAEALVDRLERWGRDRGAEYGSLQVHVDNDAAREFWTDAGYDRTFETLYRRL